MAENHRRFSGDEVLPKYSKVILIATDGLSKDFSIGAYLFAKNVVRLARGSGLLFTALYLKLCASSLQIAYGGIRTPPGLLPTPVSLTRSGFPRIIPKHHRQQMRRRDERADLLVKVYLSFFS
jgi:hypothetical protein